jgi:hypothetical protein
VVVIIRERGGNWIPGSVRNRTPSRFIHPRSSPKKAQRFVRMSVMGWLHERFEMKRINH